MGLRIVKEIIYGKEAETSLLQLTISQELHKRKQRYVA